MKLQKIGAGCLLGSFVLFILLETGLAYIPLIAAGVIDLYLVWKKERTISQWIQDLTSNKTIDYAVMVIIIAGAFYTGFAKYGFIGGFETLLPVIVTILALHLFANED